ncbi:cell cycle checkpoint protein RAD1 [Chondrus crispus]|uniref:Cell cycle checkpoint protein RAD1 n=1 Tax=Chondrus crispus TaxID=2769 RepID=R7QDN2_CHOCR|nr:cell cycle checkpoint protein RAD1 [Chondrus crispus]CDF35520.1 cell cycle checkpoint protein RAD1 [Chondrus crispus]|eukprot:XP_005715339.1 cell cycle checkpoint protein RAD1 [Chondrus crispus]
MTDNSLDVDEDDAVLYGRLDSVKPLIDALSCIYSPAHKGQDVTMTSHETHGGIRFTVEEAGCLLASVILPRRAFVEFRCGDASVRLRLNLSLLIDCLNIFGSSSAERFSAAVQIRYAGAGAPLVVRLRDGEADSVCELNTLDCDEGDDTDFRFHAHDMVNMAVVDSDALRDAMAELDYGGATTAELRMAPEPPRFRLSSPAWTVGLLGARGAEEEEEAAVCTVVLADPTDRRTDTFQAFQSRRMQTASYKLEHLGRCVKALGLSESCKVEMNAMGMVSIMCRMRGGEDGGGGVLDRCFVEFVVVAQEIEEDEDGDRDEDEGQGLGLE